MSRIKTLLKGFSGYCTIKNIRNTSKGLLTSFNFAVNSNLLQSSASNRIRNHNKFDRLGLNVVRDFPSYQLSVTFECNMNLYEFIIDEMGYNMFQTPFQVMLEDDVYDLDYTFDNCYIKNFSISVEKQGITTMSLTFAYFQKDFKIVSASFSSKKKSKYFQNKIKSLMPYYGWKVEYSDYNNRSLLSFAFNFSRQVTPRFGCIGSESVLAVEPLKLHFGLPELTFQLQYLYDEQLLNVNLNDFSLPSNDCLVQKLEISYLNLNKQSSKEGKDKKIKFDKCVTDTYTPYLANNNQYNTISISGKVFGKISTT